MKKLVTTIILLGFGFSSFCQTLPNNDFQLWTDYGAYQSPDSWNTPDSLLSMIGTITVSKSNDAYIGSYSARLETKSVLFLGKTIPGILTFADIGIIFSPPSFYVSGGLYLHENVSRMSGMYKYSGATDDSATVLIYNFKHDAGSEYDTIGYGVTYLHDASTWTSFTVDMVNLNYHVPDTFNVMIMSSSDPLFESGEGSVLLVDNLTIETNTGVINLSSNQIDVVVYPNPTTDFVRFETVEAVKNRKVIIYNSMGESMIISEFDSPNTSVNVSNLPSGTYLYSITSNNVRLNSGTFIKE